MQAVVASALVQRILVLILGGVLMIGGLFAYLMHDPRSGEILNAHIQFYQNVQKLQLSWYFTQAAAVAPSIGPARCSTIEPASPKGSPLRNVPVTFTGTVT